MKSLLYHHTVSFGKHFCIDERASMSCDLHCASRDVIVVLRTRNRDLVEVYRCDVTSDITIDAKSSKDSMINTSEILQTMA